MMKSFFDTNILAIKRKNPLTYDFLRNHKIQENITFDKTKDEKYPFLKRKNVALHSFYNPIKESQDSVAYFQKNIDMSNSDQNLIIFGSALFFHIKEFLSLEFYKKVIVFEADIQLLLNILTQFDLSAILSKIYIFLPQTSINIGNIVNLQTDKYSIYKHKSSLNFDAQIYANFEKELKLKSKIIKKVELKILLVGPIYGGSLPIFYYAQKALEDLGHSVFSIDNSVHKQSMDALENISKNPEYSKNILKKYSQLLGETIVAKSLDLKVDLVLGIAQSPFNPIVLDILRKNSIISAFWFVEDFRTLNYWEWLAPHFDFFFTIQKEPFFSKLKEIGCKNYHYLPVAADIFVHKKVDLSLEEKEKYGSPISFVGAGYYNRQKSFTTLIKKGFKIWGNGWGNNPILNSVIQDGSKRLTTLECVNIYNATDININLHSSSYTDGVNPAGDFVNPRTFEIAASQNFQLVDNRSLLVEMFAKDEIATFDSIDDMNEKIDYFLCNPNERKKYQLKSYAKVLANHTYTHRMNEMINHILLNSDIAKEKNEDSIISKQNIIGQAKLTGNKNLIKIIEQIDGNDISLSKIVEKIHKKNDVLSKEEAVFILMDEFNQFAKRKNII